MQRSEWAKPREGNRRMLCTILICFLYTKAIQVSLKCFNKAQSLNTIYKVHRYCSLCENTILNKRTHPYPEGTESLAGREHIKQSQKRTWTVTAGCSKCSQGKEHEEIERRAERPPLRWWHIIWGLINDEEAIGEQPRKRRQCPSVQRHEGYRARTKWPSIGRGRRRGASWRVSNTGLSGLGLEFYGFLQSFRNHLCSFLFCCCIETQSSEQRTEERVRFDYGS